MEHYELTESQASILNFLANGESGFFFAAIHPSDKDQPEMYEKIYNGLKEASELVELGLLQDVSEKFKEQIDKQIAESGRGYSVLVLTPEGLEMFMDRGKETIN